VRALAFAAIVTASTSADGEPIGVVVRDAGGRDALAAERLHGQIADLAVTATEVGGALEATLDEQVRRAAQLASENRARVVVWFDARDGGLVVAVATPGDRRLFVREIPADDESAVAEAAAVVARGALRAIAMGGTIGVELPRAGAREPRLVLEASIGWGVALDGGADAGAHTLAQRTAINLADWAAALELALGPPLRRGGAADVDLSRSAIELGIERRIGGFGIGAATGVVFYHRSTESLPAGLTATPSTFTPAFVIGPELRWRWTPGGPVAIEALAALDVVAGAPDLVVQSGDMTQSIGKLRVLQPRVGLNLVARLP
jgi:hypothetical protein